VSRSRILEHESALCERSLGIALGKERRQSRSIRRRPPSALSPSPAPLPPPFDRPKGGCRSREARSRDETRTEVLVARRLVGSREITTRAKCDRAEDRRRRGERRSRSLRAINTVNYAEESFDASCVRRTIPGGAPAAIETRATLLISAQRVTQRADVRRTEARMSRHEEAQRDIAADSRVIPFCLSFFATRARAREENANCGAIEIAAMMLQTYFYFVPLCTN